MKGKCRGDYEESNYNIRSVNKKYGRQLFLYGLIHRVLLSRVVKEGAVWFILLYQMLVLRALSGAQLVTSRSCIFRIGNSTKYLIDSCKTAAENAAYIYRIREFLQMEPTTVSKAEKPVPEGSGSLSVEHVDFGYLPGKQVLRDVTLTVEPGQKIALVGYNGSGKTTLVKLLLRLYDPDSGKICYHGTDIRDYQVMAYRRSVGSVCGMLRGVSGRYRRLVFCPYSGTQTGRDVLSLFAAVTGDCIGCRARQSNMRRFGESGAKL